MSSSFFTTPSSQRKRKRALSDVAASSNNRKKGLSRPGRSNSSNNNNKSKPPQKKSSNSRGKPSKKRGGEDEEGRDEDEDDEEIDSDEEIESDSDELSGGGPSGGEDEDEDSEAEFAGETAAEKRLRLAQQYLDNIRTETQDIIGFDAEEIDRDIIAERLKEDAAENKGKIYRSIASTFSFPTASVHQFRHSHHSTTAIAVRHPYIYTTTSDAYLIKWQATEPHRRPKQIRCARGFTTLGKRKADANFKGHISTILTVAASQDGKYVATGGKDGRIVIWDPEKLKAIRVFKHHRDSVNGLVFRRGTNQLYSCSADRSIKVWSLDELTYVETLFGHQEGVVGITALAAERCVTVGARDRSARLWKIADETQLVFRGGGDGGSKRKGAKDGKVVESFVEGSIDCVTMLDDENFVTGSDNGSLTLYNLYKKKAVHVYPLAHGRDPPLTPEQYTAEADPSSYPPPAPAQPRYITALASIPYSDVFFSGSWDGVVKAWRISADKKSIEHVGDIAVDGLGDDDEEEKDKEGASAADKQEVNGDQDRMDIEDDTVIVERPNTVPRSEKKTPFRGVVNGLSVFEKGNRGEEGCIVVAGIGKELRFGRWMQVKGRNGGVMFNIDKIKTSVLFKKTE